MKKLNNKGYMLIEIVIASVIALVMAYFLMDITIKLVNKNNDYYIDSVLLADKSIVTKEIMDDINSKKLTGVTVNNEYSATLTYDDGTSKNIVIDKDNKTITYGEYKKKFSKELNIGNIAVNNDNNILTIFIPAYTNYSKEDYGIKITVPYSEDIEITYPEPPINCENNNNPPELTSNLIPVTYNESLGKWVTADAANTNNQWYSYCEKKWANAVLLTEAKRKSLEISGTSYAPGQEIGDSEADGVLAFYVWIPRYKYKVWNIDKVLGVDTYGAYTKGIDIIFEEGTSTTGDITCSYDFSKTATETVRNENCTNSGTEGYYTHPAFTFGTDKLTGFWMGKFELSSSNPSATNGGNDTIELTPRILPNVKSWKGNAIGAFWQVIRNMQVTNNIYGLDTNTTAVDTHMLTNMEWGAVAYLTHSKYGRCTGEETSTCEEVSINNSTGYYTGRSGGEPGNDSLSFTPDGAYKYNENKGVLSSTTGNIYGVYDMSGGTNEYVMANLSYKSGAYSYYPPYSNNSHPYYYEYSGNEKYLTTYARGATDTDQPANNRTRLGDAMGEIMIIASLRGGWYGDYSDLFDSVDTFRYWLVRGDGCKGGSDAGIFHYFDSYGTEYYLTSTRAALAVFPPV